jgi:sRNA-binding carbon storage regulator CsrA
MILLARRVNEALVISQSVTVRVVTITDQEVSIETECKAGAVGAIPSRHLCRRNDRIELPGPVVLQIVDIQPNQVRISVDAPPNVTIHRAELLCYTLKVLAGAAKDCEGFLTPGQRCHVRDLWWRLSAWGNNSELSDLRVEKLQGSLWELKAKGSVLGKTNVRIYFAPLAKQRQVVILGVWKKEQVGKTPSHILRRMQNRLRVYQASKQD